MGGAVHGDLAVRHRFEQGRLGLGRRAVQLVGEDKLMKDRARPELELARLSAEDLGPQDVGGHQIRGELDSRERQIA